MASQVEMVSYRLQVSIFMKIFSGYKNIIKGKDKDTSHCKMIYMYQVCNKKSQMWQPYHVILQGYF